MLVDKIQQDLGEKKRLKEKKSSRKTILRKTKGKTEWGWLTVSGTQFVEIRIYWHSLWEPGSRY